MLSQGLVLLSESVQGYSPPPTTVPHSPTTVPHSLDLVYEPGGRQYMVAHHPAVLLELPEALAAFGRLGTVHRRRARVRRGTAGADGGLGAGGACMRSTR